MVALLIEVVGYHAGDCRRNALAGVPAKVGTASYAKQVVEPSLLVHMSVAVVEVEEVAAAVVAAAEDVVRVDGVVVAPVASDRVDQGVELGW